jgi:predicted XRE-type DNA-binding protein
MRDMFQKGRRPNGENLGSKLTEELVREIREFYESQEFTQGQLAEMFGVHAATIASVTARKTWKHVA